VTLHRTLRVPDDGGDYPLPPGLGEMNIYRVADAEYVVPMHRAEALWMSFEAPYWKPHALKIATGSIDAISGETFDAGALTAAPQDYVVIDEQPWLDGFKTGDGIVRQFVATPLGEGLTVEGQLSEEPEQGGLTFVLFAPKPGIFKRPSGGHDDDTVLYSAMPSSPPMGLGAGGKIAQEIYEDEHGVETWEPEPAATARVELVDALGFTALTRIPVPEPVDVAAYTAHGLPWFDLLAPTKQDITAADRLAKIKSIADLRGERDEPLPIPDEQVIRLLQLRSRVA